LHYSARSVQISDAAQSIAEQSIIEQRKQEQEQEQAQVRESMNAEDTSNAPILFSVVTIFFPTRLASYDYDYDTRD
jgi:hypothetical protein